MADVSKIEWCDSTFNAWSGCTKVGPGCDHCYAESWSKRAGAKVGKWGPGAPRVRTSAANWRQPLRWNAIPFWQCEHCGWRGEERDLQAGSFCPGCVAGVLVPARRRVFCASLADVFDNEVDPRWRADLLHLIFKTPNLDWLLLTKRIGNAQAMLEQAVADVSIGNHSWTHQWSRGFRHVALGATICNQAEAERDIPKLLATPAALRFLSIEPMLGPIDLNLGWNNDTGRWDSSGRELPLRRIDWVIAGGESGARARPMHPDWARSLRDQCAAAGVPFLFKQWGEYTAHEVDPDGTAAHLSCIDAAGRECALSRGTDAAARGEPWWHLPGHPGRGTWGPDGIPPGVLEVRRVGKKAAGRLLDGVEHNGFPEVHP